MPYDSIDQLPDTFGNLPDEAKRQALEVLNSLLDEGTDEESAIKQAWGAVKKSWEQNDEGEWVKKKAEAEELETVDLDGIEVFAVGTWNGDTYTEEDLDAMVEANKVLPLDCPVKIGHDGEVTNDGQPAVGWVENLRREGGKLLADLKKIPAKLSEVITAGGFRKRSAEVYWNYKDQDGKVWPMVFKGLALLGAEMPAVTTLDDVVALYTDEHGEVHRYVGVSTFATVNNMGSYEWLMDMVAKAMPTKPGVWYFVRATWPNQCIVSEYAEQSNTALKMWLVPYTLVGDTVQLGEWTEVKEETVWKYAEEEDLDLLASIDQFLDKMEPLIRGKKGAPKARMWVSEARKRLEDIIGSTKKQGEAGGRIEPAGEADTDEGEGTMHKDYKEHVYSTLKLDSATPEDEAEVKFMEYVQGLETAKGILDGELAELRPYKEKVFAMEMDSAIDKALQAGRIVPADVDEWKKLYTESPGPTAALLEKLPKVVDFEEHGSGESSEEPDTKQEGVLAKVKAFAAKHSLDLNKPDDYKRAVAAVRGGEA